MRVLKIDHVHIYVRDMEKAKALFSRLFGTEFSPDVIDEKYGMRVSIDPLGLELVSPLGPDSPVAKDIEKRGEGLHGISFKVEDIDAAAAGLVSAGLREVGRVAAGSLKEVQFHPRDTYGIMMELCQYRDVHGMAQAMSSG